MDSSVTFITLTNTGYVDYTKNCLISLEKINCTYPLQCYCIGKEGYNTLKNNGYDCHLIDQEENSNFQTYRHDNWSRITYNKFKIIYDNLLQYDYVCITDGDITFENPEFMSYLMKHIGEYDILIQSESMTDEEDYLLCSGFMFIKSNRHTIKLFNPELTAEYKNTKEWDDQVYINEIKDKLKYKKLPLDLFPNGRYYFKNASTIKPYLIHFNWLIGHEKKQKMSEYNRWYINRTTFLDDYYKKIIDFYDHGGENGGSGGWASLYYGIFSKVIRENGFKKCAEIGIGYGFHANEILTNTNVEKLYLIDPIKFYPNDVFAEDIMKYGGFELLFKNITKYLSFYANRYTLFRKESLSVTNDEIEDGSLDAVFIDADHSYEAVSQDLPFWWKKLRIGGWLLGDDYASCWPGTTQAVDEFAKKHNLPIEFLTKNPDGNGYPIYKFIKTKEI
jgi:hypothetical protein